MKSTFVAAVLALAVPAVYAQIAGLPECAGPCLTTNIGKSGCENPLTNFKCVCESKAFIDAATTCIADSCPAEDIPIAMGAAYELCKSVGVTIPTTLPEPEPEAPETTSTPAETTSTPAETTSTPTETTSTPTETYTSVEVTTIVTETTVEVTYPVTTLTTTLSGTGDVTPTGNSSTPTIAPPPTNSDSAAAKNVAGLGALVMAVAGFFVL